jgi:hypothetical protein
VSEAVGRVLDSALRKRGFASRDLIARWNAIVPPPFDVCTLPDRLVWPRGARHEGATLHLRCAAGQSLMVSHEAAHIASAVNRYFGYFLVRDVRLTAEPLVPTSKAETAAAEGPAPAIVTLACAGIGDDRLRTALTGLGRALYGRIDD